MQVLVLEASSSSAKAMVYDSGRGVVSQNSIPYPAEISDIKTHDIDGVYSALLAVGREAVGGMDISAVAVGGTWHSTLFCDDKLNPISRVYTWAYTEPSATAARMRADGRFTKEYYNRTGCMVHTIYPAFRLLYFNENGRDLHDKRIIGEGSYIYYRLTGEVKVSQSMASGSGLLNTHTLEWDEDILNMLGIKPYQLPELCSFSTHAPLLEDAAKVLGIRPGIPVMAAHPDGALNNVGVGALTPGVMAVSVGTSAGMRMASSRPVLHDASATWCYYAPKHWLCGCALSGAANCIDWFKNRLYRNKISYMELEDEMEKCAGEPPVFLPFLYGERCPGWHDNRLGGFVDIKGDHGTGHLYMALLEGVLYNLYQCYQAIRDVAGEPGTIHVSGGITKSRVWTQMMADIWQREIECSNIGQASLLGAAALMLYICGDIKELEDFSADRGKIVLPDSSKAGMYKNRFEKYIYWYNRTL